MKIIKKNLNNKFTFFLMVIGLPILAMILVMDIDGFDKTLFLTSFLSLLLLVYFGFYYFVAKPVGKVAFQIKSLLGGRAYKRIKPSSPDEIGIFTHFFNEVTKNIESISVDLIDQKRMVAELEIAREIQRDTMPQKIYNIDGLDIVAKSKSAVEMGGDSFDFINNGKDHIFYIGDVSGHGVPAGLVMMMVNTLIHAYVANNRPHEILSRVNEILFGRISAQRFMSLVMMRWDPDLKEMFYTGAGHEHILVFRAKTGEVELIKSGGIAIKMIPDISRIISEKKVIFDVDDVLLLYTDGITELKNNGNEMFGVKSLANSLKRHGDKKTSKEIFDHISEDLNKFAGNNVINDDDMTMITIKRSDDHSGSISDYEWQKDHVSEDLIGRIW